MGTYLWCPDELERMKEIGNARAWALYTGGAPPGTIIEKPASGSAFDVRDRFARDKYEARKWVHPGGMAAVLAEETATTNSAATAPAPRVRKMGTADAKARRDARSKVQAMRHGRQGVVGAESGNADAQTLLPATAHAGDDDWASAEWDSWSPPPRVSSGTTCAAVAAVPAPKPALATPPSVQTRPTDAFDAFFRECVGGTQQNGATGGGCSSTDLIDLFVPSPTVTTGLLARQVSAH